MPAVGESLATVSVNGRARRPGEPVWPALALLLAVLAARRWQQFGELPVGLDGGQWLALGRGLFGAGRSTGGAYPPLVPLLTHLLAALTGPMAAVRIVAIASLLLAAVAFYLVAREAVGSWPALALTAVVAPASALTEPAAFGGYPQLVAFAAMLVAVWALGRFLAAGRRRDLLAGAGMLAVAALAHHVYFPLGVLVAGAVWLIWLTARPTRAALARGTLGLAGAVAVSVACFLPTALAFRAAGYAPPLAASDLEVMDALRYGTREAPGVWLGVIVAGVIGLTLTVAWRDRPGWQVAAAMTVVGGGVFLTTAEVRVLPLVLAGVVLGAGIGGRAWWDRLGWGWQFGVFAGDGKDVLSRCDEDERTAAGGSWAADPGRMWRLRRGLTSTRGGEGPALNPISRLKPADELGDLGDASAADGRSALGSRAFGMEAFESNRGAVPGPVPGNQRLVLGRLERAFRGERGVFSPARPEVAISAATPLRSAVMGRRLQPAAIVPLAVLVALPVFLWPRADQQASSYADYYRVVDRSMLAAAEVVARSEVEGLVVVRHDQRGWPVGWWFEGLTEAPIAVGSSARWLGFPDERERAQLAGRFFAQPLSGPELIALAAETDVELLVFRKWEWIGWRRWIDAPGRPVTVLFDDDEFMVLRVRRE